MGNIESVESAEPIVEKEEYQVRCHCGQVQARFRCSKEHVIAWDCSCSDCSMRGNIHIIVPSQDFRISIDKKEYNSATTEYLWGTKTAKRRFCKSCGILPWYRPRSNPDGYGITLKCIDWGDKEKPTVEIKQFDGSDWEKSYEATNIAAQSQPSS